MSEQENLTGSGSILKQKLLAALQSSITGSGEVASVSINEEHLELNGDNSTLADDSSVYSLLVEESEAEAALPPELMESRARLTRELEQIQRQGEASQAEEPQKTDFDDTLSKRGVVPDAQTETYHPAGAPSSSVNETQVKTNSVNSGGSMADLSGYKDLSKAPISFGDEELPMSTLTADSGFERSHTTHSQFSSASHFVQEVAPQEVDTEFSGNVKTLIRLVNELPEGVTKQTGAQIIRLTMEAMGISMEDVLSEAQSAQSEMLDAVRANIKKIEEYKTVIRKLETDIKYYQGKANELSEIIDLFILSNTTGNKMPIPDDLNH
ncbi:MAG: hypothetical protein K0Q50_1492 [Vampirovibrio sp.]|jgi:hypothetical protein|nr:hypothetical protein [Vampirovibrio sp.]